MAKILKTSLALVLALMLCLGSFVALGTSDAEATLGYTITYGTPNTTAKTVDATVTFNGNVGVSASLFTLNFGAEYSIVSVTSDYNLMTNMSDGDTPFVAGTTNSIKILVDDTGTPANGFSVVVTLSYDGLEAPIAITMDDVQAATEGTTEAIAEGSATLFATQAITSSMSSGTDTASFEIPSDDPVEPVYNSTVKTNGTNAIFASDYTYIYYMKKANYDAWTDVSIRVEKDRYDGSTKLEPQIVTLTGEDITATEDIGGTKYYAFSLTGISAKEVASALNATVYATVNGVPSYGPARTSNLVDYAVQAIATPGDFANAMVAFLNYAASAQTYFNFNTDNLANASLTPAQKAYTDPTLEDKKRNAKVIEQSAKISGFNLQFKSQILMTVYINAMQQDIADLYLDFAWTDSSGGPHHDVRNLADCGTETISEVSYYAYNYEMIPAKDMRTIIQMKIVDKDGNELSNTREYSIESYAYGYASHATLGGLVKSMIVFSDKLATYFQNR